MSNTFRWFPTALRAKAKFLTRPDLIQPALNSASFTHHSVSRTQLRAQIPELRSSSLPFTHPPCSENLLWGGPQGCRRGIGSWVLPRSTVHLVDEGLRLLEGSSVDTLPSTTTL